MSPPDIGSIDWYIVTLSVIGSGIPQAEGREPLGTGG